MLTRIATKTTDATRRAALQLATQLPEDVLEARAVLVQLGELLEGFLIRVPREICNAAAEPPGHAGSRTAHRSAVLLMIALLVVLAPVAAMLAWLTGCDAAAGFVLFAGVALSSLIFGQIYGLAFSALAALAQNFLVMVPLFHFTVPGRVEVVRLIGFAALALALPLLANVAQRWRALLLSGSSAAVPRSRQSGAPEFASPVRAAALSSIRDRSSPE